MDGALPPQDWLDADVGDVAPGVSSCSPLASLDRLPAPADWDALAVAAGEPNPFYEGWFLRPSLEHLGGEGVRLLTVWRGDRLLGLMPIAPRRGYARMPLRLLTNWAHYHLFLGAPLVAADAYAEFWRAALPALDEAAGADLLHFAHLPEDGPAARALLEVAGEGGRPAAVVHRETRALYAPDRDAAAYYEAHVRKKKRKELGRLEKRLAELGRVAVRRLARSDDVAPWAAAFLALEAAGWKGREGSALACQSATRAFWTEMLAAAHARGLLDAVSLDVDGRPAAMLCTLLPSGCDTGYSYKIAYDEALARFSPGVLLQIANLDLPARRGLSAVDSCAVEDHPMINSLWAERRTLVRITLARDTRRSRGLFHLARLAERGAAWARTSREPA